MTTFVLTNQITGEYDNEQALHTYKEGLDLEFLREYCMKYGERYVIERTDLLHGYFTYLLVSIPSSLPTVRQ